MKHEEMAVVKAALNKFRMAKVRSFITLDSREKARKARIGLKRSDESKIKMRLAALGRKHSEETKEKIRLARSKQTTTPKMLKALADNRGEKSLLWKGPDVGYRALHRWVEKRLGKPTACEHCEKVGLQGHFIHWANISEKYQRDTSDWIRLCALCHKQYDKNKKLST